MKKFVLIFVFLFLITGISFSQENRLILVHPTEYNLKLFTYLIDSNIIQIDHLKITGVYHNNEVYDFSWKIIIILLLNF